MANTAAPHPQTQPLLNSLQARFSLNPTPAWLSNFLHTTRAPFPPLPALTSTAHFRLLASDLTTTLSRSDPATLFPPGIDDIATKEKVLSGEGVPVQVLDIMDVGSSKWAQVEAMERVERGEEVRGREVIRTVGVLDDEEDEGRDQRGQGGWVGGQRRGGAAGASSNGGNPQNQQQQSVSAKRSHGPHKLVVQDAAGTKAVAFELESVPRLFIGGAGCGSEANGGAVEGMSIGCKLVLQPGTVVRRGMIMLTPTNVKVLGGKIEPWDRKWREDRKKRLIDEVVGEQEQQEEEQQQGTARRRGG